MTARPSMTMVRRSRVDGRFGGILLAAAALGFVAVACGTSAAPATVAVPSGGSPAPATSAAPAALPAGVDVAGAVRLRDAGAFVLDVREPDEWAAGHIEGATLVPLGELASRLNEVPRSRQVVVVCRSGNRSAQGRDVLLGAGFPSVTSMDGGMNAWTAAGQPVVSGP